MEEKYRREAQKRVKSVKRFYNLLYTWVILSVFLSGINFFTSPEYFWAFFPIMGIGLGVAFSALKAFGYRGMRGDWEEEERLSEPSDEDLELKELEELKRKWEDQDFV